MAYAIIVFVIAVAIIVARVYFNMRKASIYGGSNEIQKNIIAQMILGL